ncbi:MAG: hypothetical protein LBH04_03410 [Tannerellaceae bacterium]|jgi:predicted HicB family RNase H-like nuclease|nr:hypothetical protein [Tannerellaceae bacterium]
MDNRDELLNVFEGKVYEIIGLCERQKKRINELERSLQLKEQELQDMARLKDEWKVKYDNMLTVRVVSASPIEIKSARKRLADLVKEVDKCIKILKNE